MAPTEQIVSPRVLLVDDDDGVRAMMHAMLQRKGFEVVVAASVTDALRHIATESFDVLITDLHMPDPGDGFTVVTAMRHSQPNALTLLVSGYPDVQSAMAAILLEADEIIVKPFRCRQTRRTRPREVGHSQTCCPRGQGGGWCDPAALPSQHRGRSVGTCETE
jgi:DNA-binding NtrC family response regulator